MLTAAAGLLLAAAPLVVPSDAAYFDPATGYRITHYRAVVPIAPEGVDRLSIGDVVKMARTGRAILVDVSPAEGGIRDTVTGRWHLAMSHETIPGAHWFPEAGRGQLVDGIERWFVDGVKHLQSNRRDRSIVVFCLADCWMSWNAARRLHGAGLYNVKWFAEGIDGWRENGRTLVRARLDPQQ